MNSGPPGDLYIEVRVKKHDIFERDGDDLHCIVPISFPTAAIGGETEVPTLEGKAVITIPKGTQNSKQVNSFTNFLTLALSVKFRQRW